MCKIHFLSSLEKRKPNIAKNNEQSNPKISVASDKNVNADAPGSNNLITNEPKTISDMTSQYFPNSFRCVLSNRKTCFFTETSYQ